MRVLSSYKINCHPLTNAFNYNFHEKFLTIIWTSTRPLNNSCGDQIIDKMWRPPIGKSKICAMVAPRVSHRSGWVISLNCETSESIDFLLQLSLNTSTIQISHSHFYWKWSDSKIILTPRIRDSYSVTEKSGLTHYPLLLRSWIAANTLSKGWIVC